MNNPLHTLLLNFFDLPPETPAESINQARVEKWDSFATVQLIVELQSVFGINFEVDEIERLQSYDAIAEILKKKGVELNAGGGIE